MEHLNILERDVLDALLTGDIPLFALLRQQTLACRVLRRTATGTGFYADLHVDPTAPTAPLSENRLVLDDVVAEIEGLEHGARFALWVDKGVLTCLEGYAYEERWPLSIGKYRLSYLHQDGRKMASERDLTSLQASLEKWERGDS